MLRDKSLIPLSRQHQHALALCVRIDRASPILDADLGAWQAEIVQQVEAEIRIHFEAEETILFPAARRFDELVPLIEELMQDHSALRNSFELAARNSMSAEELSAFAGLLSAHIRKEERQLFQRLQELMTPQEVRFLGEPLQAALERASEACGINPPRAKAHK